MPANGHSQVAALTREKDLNRQRFENLRKRSACFFRRNGFSAVWMILLPGRDSILPRWLSGAARSNSCTKNDQEVASIHRIPCEELFRHDAPVLQGGQESGQPVLFMPVGHTCIATPTAAMLYQFREVALAGTSNKGRPLRATLVCLELNSQRASVFSVTYFCDTVRPPHTGHW